MVLTLQRDSQKVLIDASRQVVNRHNHLTHNAGVQVAMAIDHLYAGMYEHLLAVQVCKVGITTTCGCRASAYKCLGYSAYTPGQPKGAHTRQRTGGYGVCMLASMSTFWLSWCARLVSQPPVGVVLLHTGRYVTDLAHWDSRKVLIHARVQVFMVLTLPTGTAKTCS